MSDELLTVEEVSKKLGVAPNTVREWVRKGALRALRVGPGGLIRVPKSALDEFLKPTEADRSHAV